MERDRAQDNTPVAVESTPVALLPRFEAFLGAWAAAARTGDASGLDQFYAADAVLEDVPLNLTFRGPAEIAGFAGVVFGSFSEATVTWRSAFAADGWATAE